MMFDFSEIPFFDNHSHLLNTSNRSIDLKEFLGPLNHGYVDRISQFSHFRPNDNAGDNKPQWLSDDMLQNITCNTGIAKTFVHYLAQYLGCEETPEAVLAERNKRSVEDMKAYTRSLYEDQHIIAEVVDEPLPMGDPAMECFPCNVYRLYQTDSLVFRLISECESYDELLDNFDTALRHAILVERFVGVKCHILEVNHSVPHYVSKSEAETVFRRAKKGENDAKESIYMAVFCHMLLMTQELDFPVHLHTGLTGKVPYKDVRNCDPLCFVELLGDTRFVNSHLVFLHVAYPFVRSASVMAATYPNVWIDFAQVLPWEVINFPNILEEAMGFASLAKITFGSGAHTHPELNWMAAKVAKKSLAIVLEKAVNNDFMSKTQAEKIAEMMLYKNLQRLYKLDKKM
ncbi:MAG: amidohydrolase family protein [Clostridiales bacterium]|nr:amidohydrolase family protein [Clostridiales bacterium]